MAGARVLVAEDSATMRRLVARTLSAAGYDVVEAEDGAEALDEARATKPDVVVTDVEMPRLDGRGLLAALQADEVLATVPVIVLTQSDSTDTMVEALAAGAADFLQKPFKEPELLARVASAARNAALQDELRRRSEELEAFASRASHDLKSPLSIIRGMAETLAHAHDRLDEAQRTMLLGAIGTAADRAAAMVTDLLTLARTEPTSDAVAPATDAREVLDTIVERTAFTEGDEVEVGGAWAAVQVPKPELLSVLGNLVENARHYGRSDDGVLRLQITAASDADRLVVHLDDAGRGIAPEDAARLFEPFVRLADSSSINPQSTGIGLAIVRRGIERWGGTVAIERSPAGGARFVVTLPLAAP